jgi:hypothetical protein
VAEVDLRWLKLPRGGSEWIEATPGNSRKSVVAEVFPKSLKDA